MEVGKLYWFGNLVVKCINYHKNSGWELRPILVPNKEKSPIACTYIWQEEVYSISQERWIKLGPLKEY